MAGFGDWDDYRNDIENLAEWEQVLKLDEEIANYELFGLDKYVGPVGPNDYSDLKQYYSTLFSDIIIQRINGIVETSPIEIHQNQFDTFRRNLININNKLAYNRSETAATIPEPAEQLLLKRIRKRGYDPTNLDISHIERGGPLYLLELFVTAAYQQANVDLQTDGGTMSKKSADANVSDRTTSEFLVEELIAETKELGKMETDQVRSELKEPVLMVNLWENQSKGLEKWLENDREGILEMATATGKTVAGIGAVAHICGERPDIANHERRTKEANILVIAHSNAILSQWKRELSEKLGLSQSAFRGDAQPDDLTFSTASVEFKTAHSLLPRHDPDLKSKYDLLIVDEVHHYSNKEGFGKAITRPNYEDILGLSATIGKDETDPKRSRIQDIIAPIVYTYDLEDAIRDGVIPDFDWKVHPTALDPSEQEEWRKSTNSITNKFSKIQKSSKTEEILENLSVPFNRFNDLGDFVQALKAISYSDYDTPDSWEDLQRAIYSRTNIRHQSQPKIQSAIDLAKQYLTEKDTVKLVMFSMRINTADQINEALEPYTDHAYAVHSNVAKSNKKKDEIINRRINKFSNADHGVLVAPQLLDEGIDVPDAEVGINVAGTKTKLQLVQRMGRVLRKYGDQRPTFHHFVAVPDQNYVHGLDSKAYVQEINWVRELGELIRKQPKIEPADVDEDVLARAEERGHELWAQHLVEEWELETVQGTVKLNQILESLTLDIAAALRNQVDYSGRRLSEEDWQQALESLRREHSTGDLQRVWWLFPLYREQPATLEKRLTDVIEKLRD